MNKRSFFLIASATLVVCSGCTWAQRKYAQNHVHSLTFMSYTGEGADLVNPMRPLPPERPTEEN